MFVLVGLGNPGPQYDKTRHNAGFMLIDSIAEDASISINQSKFKSVFGRGKYQGHDVILVKPQTYINLSGTAVQQFLNFFKVSEQNLIVMFDDLDLTPGVLKTRVGGGHGGHNGMRSILECLPSDKFFRIKVGIGKPTHKNATADWVLHPFSKQELDVLYNETFPLAKERILHILECEKKYRVK